MASLIDMSLEDIIKNKRINTRPKRTNKPNRLAPPQRLPVTDARNKIISKKRVQLTDARDKLAEIAKQKDARLKLEQLRLQRMTRSQAAPARNVFQQNRGKFTRAAPNKERDPSRQVVSQPLSTTKLRRQIDTKRFMENRSIGSRNSDKIQRPKPILRTVENDIEIIDDPMEDDYMPPKPNLLNRKASLQLKIIAHNDARETRSSAVHRTAIVEKDQSPPRPPSILKKRPMAALRSEKKPQNTEKPALEYRIIVSNLRNTVTGGDIEELFGDVGGMLESRLVRPGTAEVIYKSQEDAQRSVDLYHNRQLDGQPMNCLLVTPRSPAAPPRSSTKPSLYSTNSNVEPDISTFHKVLFSNL